MERKVIFKAHILVDKLSKIKNSQPCIEKLSHWCIFHRRNAKQIVDIWERLFHCSPRDQRVPYLNLANDILQNSRWKGLEFINEFWKVLPSALNDVVQNGKESERRDALRLVEIWDERKVFGSHGQVLKIILKNLDRISKRITYKVKPPAGGEMIQKLVYGYALVTDGPANENAIFRKCRTAISFIEKLEKDSGEEFNLGNIRGPGVLEELKGQQGFLKDSIEQLKLAESSRATLLSHLREALHEQEYKIRPIRNQLQVAEWRNEQVEKLLSGQTVSRFPDQQLNEIPPPPPSSSFVESPPPPLPSSPFVESPPPPLPSSPFVEDPPLPDYPADSPVDMILSTPPHYTQQQPQGPSVGSTYPHTTNEVHLQTSAGEVAPKLPAPTSSSHMLGYVLSSLATEGVIGQPMSADYLHNGNKRPRLHNTGLGSVPFYVPQPQQPAPQPFPRPDFFQPAPPPPPPISQIPPPLPESVTAPPQFGQTAGPMMTNSNTFVWPVPPCPVVGMPTYLEPPNAYRHQGSGNGGHFSHTTTDPGQ